MITDSAECSDATPVSCQRKKKAQSAMRQAGSDTRHALRAKGGSPAPAARNLCRKPVPK